MALFDKITVALQQYNTAAPGKKGRKGNVNTGSKPRRFLILLLLLKVAQKALKYEKMLLQGMMEGIWDICNEEKHNIQDPMDFDTLQIFTNDFKFCKCPALHIFMFDKL